MSHDHICFPESKLVILTVKNARIGLLPIQIFDFNKQNIFEILRVCAFERGTYHKDFFITSESGAKKCPEDFYFSL